MAYMKDSTGRRLDTFAVAPLRKPTIILFGDSRTGDCSFDDATNGLTTNLDWFTWGQANTPTGPVFDMIRNAGIGGNTTTQMLARIDTDVLAHNPSHMTLWGGINDLWTSFADVDATYGRMVQMMTKARAAGVYVFLISETTASTSLKGNNYPIWVQYYNDKLRAYAATAAGVEFWDFNAHIIDPLSTVGQPRSGILRDGVHLNVKSASTIGKLAVAPRLARFGTTVTQLPHSIIDSQYYNTALNNALTNPLMTGATGSKSAGHTGTLPDGWNSNGTPTAVCSVVPRTDGYGNDVKLEISASAAGSMSLVNTITSTRFTPGATYVIEASLSVSNPVNLYSVALLGQFFNGATTYTYGHGNTVQGSVDGDNMVASTSLILRSKKFIAPAAFTSTSMALTIRFAGAGSGTVMLGRVAWRRVS